jgi:hypothetical protein
MELMGHLEQFRKMHNVAAGSLSNLLSAAKSVSQNNGVLRKLSDLGKKHKLTYCVRYVDVFGIEPNRTRHAAAATV